MKFEQQLEFNAVAEWREHYINYEQLKRLIYSIEQGEAMQSKARTSLDLQRQTEAETTPLQQPLLNARHSSLSVASSGDKAFDPETEFVRLVENELDRVAKFFLPHSDDLLRRWRDAGTAKLGAEGSFRRSKPALFAELGPSGCWLQRETETQRAALLRDLKELYVDVYNLSNFSELNETGFRKILKKHDKVTERPVKDQFMPLISRQLGPRREALLPVLSSIPEMYAELDPRNHGGPAEAEILLKRDVQEQVTFERQAVWKDRMEEERRHANASVVDSKRDQQSPAVKAMLRYRTPVSLAAAAAILVGVMASPAFESSKGAEAKRACLGILLSSALLWCVEAMDTYATSMAIPFLVVTLRALNDAEGNRLSSPDAMKRVFSVIFSQTIMLLLGGFAMASALSKHLIAKRLAIAVLKKVGRHPSRVLLASMGIALFGSMWISNVAAPVLCYSIVQPILRTLSADDPFSTALVIGIALAANVGGMTSPIASPQNIFAIERMSVGSSPPSWLSWFSVSLPVCLVMLLLLWRYLAFVYPLTIINQEIRPLRQLDDPFTYLHCYVVGVCVLTMGLWCSNSWIEVYVGGMGVTALVPMVAFFGSGVLNKSDFESFPWSVVMLAMGGIVLGDAATCSGLLTEMASVLALMVSGFSTWEVLAVFCLVIGIVTSFISHTVGAMVMLPIVQSVGEEVAHATGVDHTRLLIMGCALMCSGGMALSISGFPNITASSILSPTGIPYVRAVDFALAGIPGTIFALISVLVVGYPLMQLVGF